MGFPSAGGTRPFGLRYILAVNTWTAYACWACSAVGLVLGVEALGGFNRSLRHLGELNRLFSSFAAILLVALFFVGPWIFLALFLKRLNERMLLTGEKVRGRQIAISILFLFLLMPFTTFFHAATLYFILLDRETKAALKAAA